MRPAILIAMCAATGCGTDVTLLTWDTVDLDDVTGKLAAPTATVADLKAGIAKIGDELGDLEALGAGFDLYEAIDDPDETAPTVYDSSDDQGTGTQFYERIACPGPKGDGPDPDFAFGSIRLDSPTIRVVEELQEGESIPIAGPLFLTFDECRAGDALMVGGISGYYDDVQNVLGLDGELTIDLVEEDRILRQGPVIIYQDSEQVAVAWFIVPERYGTARAVSGSGFVSFGVDLADGSAVCTIGDGLTCEITSE